MKKYIEKLKDLKSTNKKLYISIICMLLLVGVTFAYVAAQITGGVFKNLNLFADTTDQLLFDVDKDLSLTATQFNFAEGGSNLSDTSIATARLKANSTNKTANYNYNVYLVIEENEFKYTTTDKKTEILLQVTDPNGNALTTLDGLTYNNTLNGFDITEEQGILAVAENFAIASNSSTNWTSQNWTFTVTFINLDTNQKENAGKHMSGKIKIQQLTETPSDLTVAVNNLPDAYGPLATLNCKGSESVYNQQYNRIEVSNISKNQSFCNVTYNDRNEKQYLNDYIMGLEGTVQGGGELIHELDKVVDSNASYNIVPMDYESISEIALNENANKFTNTADSSHQYTYYKFIPKSDGFYKMCFDIPAAAQYQYNGIYIYNLSTQNNMQSIYSIYNGTNSRTGCYDYGWVTTDDYIYMGFLYYDKNSTVWFEKTENYSIIDVGYRYEGKNPNNYVWFNNELWRIIGVFDESNHGISNQLMVKIIKESSLGGMSRNFDSDDSSLSKGWDLTILNKLLNDGYINKTNMSNTKICEDFVGNCNFQQNGINRNYKNMIQESKWFLGSLSNYDSDSNYMQTNVGSYYIREREKTDFDSNLSLNGFIGLMYASDYGYASLSKTCSRNEKLSNYSITGCSDLNWLFNQVSEWTITSIKYDSGAYIRGEVGGNIESSTASSNYHVRPTIYLKSHVEILNGIGSRQDPYIIGM